METTQKFCYETSQWFDSKQHCMKHFQHVIKLLKDEMAKEAIN